MAAPPNKKTKLIPVSQIEPYLKILVYGEPGAGKTTFACSGHNHPQMGEVVVINIEGGMLAVAGTSAKATEQVTTIEEVEAMFWSIKAKRAPYDKVKTVVVDSGTEFQTVMLGEIVRKKIVASGDKQRDIDDIYLEDYGNCTKKMARIMRWFRDLPCNVIVTALVREEAPAPTKSRPRPDPTLAYPDFTRKLANKVRGYFDHVWYLWRDADTGVHSMITQNTGIFKCKTRGEKFAPALGLQVDNPKLDKIFDLLIQTETSYAKDKKDK